MSVQDENGSGLGEVAESVDGAMGRDTTQGKQGNLVHGETTALDRDGSDALAVHYHKLGERARLDWGEKGSATPILDMGERYTYGFEIHETTNPVTLGELFGSPADFNSLTYETATRDVIEAVFLGDAVLNEEEIDTVQADCMHTNNERMRGDVRGWLPVSSEAEGSGDVLLEVAWGGGGGTAGDRDGRDGGLGDASLDEVDLSSRHLWVVCGLECVW